MGNERFRASFDFFKAKLTTALSIPENPSRRALLLKTRDVAMVTVANYIIPPVTMTETFSKSENLQAKPLVVIYAPGIGGGTFEESPSYQGIHAVYPEIEWITVNADFPKDPNIIQWKRVMHQMIKKQIAQGKDIYLIGHSAGAALVSSLLLDTVDESSEFYDPSLPDHIIHVLSLASPNVAFPGSADRKKIREVLKLKEYPKIFRSYATSQLRKFQKAYGNKTTFVTAALDDELLNEGNELANLLGNEAVVTYAGHGMEGTQAQMARLFTDHISVYTSQQPKQTK